VIAVVLLMPATSLATPTNSTPPSFSANPQVGQAVTCQPGVWTTESGGQVTDTDFTWYLDSTSDPVYESDSGVNNTYVPTASELGHVLICEETVFDTGDDSTATAYSVASAAVLPVPSVTITQYSPALSGNIGENLAGVQVAVHLLRPTDLGSTTDQIASASTTTSADGSWTATLSPSVTGPADAFGAAGDQLTTEYSPPIAMPSVPVPASLTYADSGVFGPDGQMFQGDRSIISADGTTITSQSVTEPDCASLSFIIDGHTEPAAAAGTGNCQLSPSSAMSNADHVQAAYTGEYQGETVANLTTVSDVGLLGTGAVGAPTCTGDLVTGQVTCDQLDAGSFAVQLNGGTPIPLIVTPETEGGSNSIGVAFVNGLAPGVTLTLDETAPTVTTRHLTTLHLVNLRIDTAPDGSESGTCQPDKLFTGGPLCPASGAFPASLDAGTSLFDDLGGGNTLVNVPTLFNLVPSANDTVAGGTFTAYANLGNIGTTAQILASTQSVNLQIVPRGASTPVFNQDMTPGSDSVGPFEKLGVSGLAEGEYIANWLLTDSHGDTSTFTDSFVVQPADTGPAGKEGAQGKEGGPGPGGQQGVAGPQGTPGPQGSAGQQGATGPGGTPGPQGPAGKDGTSSLAKCVTKVTGKGTHKHTKLVCTVSVLAPGAQTATVRVSRGRTIVALGTATLHRGIARLTLHNLQALRRGRYLVTLVSGTGKRTSVTHAWLTTPGQ